MSVSAIERVIRTARRRIAGQRLLELLVVGWVVTLGGSVLWGFTEPIRWWVPVSLLTLATVAAIVRTTRAYPARIPVALELDSRFGLKERITAASELSDEQRATPTGVALVADAERHVGTLRVRDQFPLRLPRVAWLIPVFAALLVYLNREAESSAVTTAGETTPRASDTAVAPGASAIPPRPETKTSDAEKPDPQRLAAIRAELDRLEAESRKDDPGRVERLTAAGDAARSMADAAVQRLGRMESQLKQLESLAKSPNFKDGGAAADAAKALAQGDLTTAEQALDELAKNAAAKPNDAQLQKQIEQLKNEIRRAAENTSARANAEKAVENAKRNGSDTSGPQRELDRLNAEQSQALKDLASKLDGAAKAMQKGNGEEAAKQLSEAADAVRDIRNEARAAQDAQAQAQRADQLRADAGPSDPNREPGGPGGGNGLASTSPSGIEPKNQPREVKPGVPFVDRKVGLTPVGSGGFGGGFTPTDSVKLGPAIKNAAATAPTTLANQSLTPDDKAAVREFFERLGK